MKQGDIIQLSRSELKHIHRNKGMKTYN